VLHRHLSGQGRGWRGHFCKPCAKKIKAPPEATTRERALAERDVPGVQ
jgi:hypothetical protein